MAISDEIREQTVKMKDMTFKGKMSYIWEYYKLWIIGITVLIIAVCSFVKSMVANSRPTYIDVTFINSQVGMESEAIGVKQDFIDALGIDTGEYNVVFDYSLFLDNTSMTNTAYAGQMKLMAQYAASELDVICGPESTITGAANAGSYGNLEELLPPGMLDGIIARGYEPFYFTEILDNDLKSEIDYEVMEAENAGREISEETRKKMDSLPVKTYIGGIYIDNCDYLNSQGEFGIYPKKPDDRAVLTIAPNSKNVDHAIEFIQFVTK